MRRVRRAQEFSHDGYTSDGAYMLNVELTPYAFVPHVGMTMTGVGPQGDPV